MQLEDTFLDQLLWLSVSKETVFENESPGFDACTLDRLRAKARAKCIGANVHNIQLKILRVSMERSGVWHSTWMAVGDHLTWQQWRAAIAGYFRLPVNSQFEVSSKARGGTLLTDGQTARPYTVFEDNGHIFVRLRQRL